MRNEYNKPIIGVFILITLVLALQGCYSSYQSRYTQKYDSAPNFEYEEIEYVEPTPRYEPYSIWNSRPYQINGRYYTPMLTGKGFVQKGQASWYGQKFHGHKTANGEVFDMFELTAAHTTLPLPSFARVTNLENGKTTIVRINDRGPFHRDRVLDLSYAAAKKLGFKEKGTTTIKLEVIHVDEQGIVSIGNESQRSSNGIKVAAARPLLALPKDNGTESVISKNLIVEDKLFVQVMAISDSRRAKNLAKGIGDLLQLPTQLPKLEDVYRLQVGPLENEQKAEKVIQSLANIGFEDAFAVSYRAQ